MLRSTATFSDKIIGPDPTDLSSKDSLLKCRNCFHGFDSLQNDQNFLDIAGVNLESFNLLLKILCNCKKIKVSKENRLLIFLVKMKLGSTFSAIGIWRTQIDSFSHFLCSFENSIASM